MAASDARPVPRKNVAYRVYLPILDADGDLVTGAATLDSEVSIDGAAFADCSAEATEIGASGMYYLDLTAAEMNGDAVVVIVKTGTAGAKTTPITLYPEEAGDFRADVTAVGVDAVLDEQIGDSTITMRQALKLVVATLGGKLSGAATTTVTIRNAADSANVVVATVDADGNRSAVTLTL